MISDNQLNQWYAEADYHPKISTRNETQWEYRCMDLITELRKVRAIIAKLYQAHQESDE
jgi:hypothetical protein